MPNQDRFEYYEKKFTEILDALAVIDKALRGNGVPGLNERVRQLERMALALERLKWVILTATVTSCVVSVVAFFFARG